MSISNSHALLHKCQQMCQWSAWVPCIQERRPQTERDYLVILIFLHFDWTLPTVWQSLHDWCWALGLWEPVSCLIYRYHPVPIFLSAERTSSKVARMLRIAPICQIAPCLSRSGYSLLLLYFNLQAGGCVFNQDPIACFLCFWKQR